MLASGRDSGPNLGNIGDAGPVAEYESRDASDPGDDGEEVGLERYNRRWRSRAAFLYVWDKIPHHVFAGYCTHHCRPCLDRMAFFKNPAIFISHPFVGKTLGEQCALE